MSYEFIKAREFAYLKGEESGPQVVFVFLTFYWFTMEREFEFKFLVTSECV